MEIQQGGNFGFLAARDSHLARLGALAESYFRSDPPAALLKLRLFGEALTKQVVAQHGVPSAPSATFDEVLREGKARGIFPQQVADLLFQIKRWGNAAAHEDRGAATDALNALKFASAIGVWYHRTYLRVANVQRGWLRLNEIKNLAVTAEERDRVLLKDGDILMNEGGDRDKLGRGWVWREEVLGCIHQNHVFRVRLKDQDFPPEFVSHYANEFGQAYFIDQGTQTTNLASISKRRVMALPVPVPPAAEAREIVRLITAAFARADRLEAEATRARALLNRLEAAILAKAFRGELVPQDPNDEPASVLLDRIRAERAAAPKPERGRARKAVG